MSFLTQQQVVTSNEFIAVVRHAVVKAAIAVAAEAPETDNHADRLALAARVLNAPTEMAQLIAVGVVTNAQVNEESTDDAIEFTVNSMWDAYSTPLAPAAS